MSNNVDAMSDNTFESVVLVSPPAPRLLDQVRDRLRVKHYSLRTEKAYLAWIRRYIIFHDKRHPAQMGKVEVEAFLTHLAVDRDVAAATQGQALSAILFLYQDVLELPIAWLDDVVRAKRPARLPTVLTQEDTRSLLAALGADTQMALIVRLLYGTGMRLLESPAAAGQRCRFFPAGDCDSRG